MKVFVIPSWHPTPEKSNWCNWVKPHIEASKLIAEEVVVLQVDQETTENTNQITELGENHYYIASGGWKSSRTLFCYQIQSKNYYTKLEQLYLFALKKHGKPDIIHAHVSMPAGYGASILGKKYKIPVIVTEHYSGFFSDNRFFWRLKYFYFKMRKNINGLYAVSPGFKNRIERITNIKVDGVTPNPINTELFSFKSKQTSNGMVHFVSTGTFGKIKGTDILIKAFSQLKDDYNWHLTIIGNKLAGTEDYWNNFLKTIPSDRLTVLKPMNQKELAEIYSKCDVFVVSSRMETANVSMLEAMACGCYVITNKIEAPETLLNDEVCMVFENTVSSLKNCIIEVFENPLPDRYSQRLFVEDNFSFNTIKNNIKKLYENYI